MIQAKATKRQSNMLIYISQVKKTSKHQRKAKRQDYQENRGLPSCPKLQKKKEKEKKEVFMSQGVTDHTNRGP